MKNKIIFFGDSIIKCKKKNKVFDWTKDLKKQIKTNSKKNYFKKFTYVGLNTRGALEILPNIIRKNITYNNFESKKERILIISNFKRQKNIEFAVELFATYLKNDEMYFDIYGQSVDQGYLEEIKSKIDSKNINDSINIIHNCSDTQAILKNYRYEGSPPK